MAAQAGRSAGKAGNISCAGQPPLRRMSGQGQQANDLGEFGVFLAAELESLQSRVLARLEQDLASGAVQRPCENTLATKKEVRIEQDMPTARWGRLVAAAMEADVKEDVRRSNRSATQELWKPHPEWQAMEDKETGDEFSPKASRGKSLFVAGLFVDDQVQTAIHGSENTGAGMLENSSDSWLARLVLHPDGARAIVWSALGLILICYETITIPLVAAGLNDKPSTALAAAILAYWVLDMLAHSLTGYIHDVTLEMRPSYTLRQYAKTWMAIDLALVSVDVFFLVFAEGGVAQTLRILRLLRMARLVRVERWKRMGKNLIIGRQSELLELILRLAALILSLLVVCHLVACSWYGLGDQLPGNGSWLEMGDFLDGSNARKYAVSFHWTITQFTPSTNNIHPQTTEERCFAILVVIMGMVMFSTFLSSLSSTVNAMRSYGSKLAMEKHRLMLFTKQRGLTHVITQKILSFCDSEGRREKMVVTEADLPLLSQLPPAIQMGMRAELYFPSLRPHPLFSAVVRNEVTFCVALCHQTMSEERHMAQQVVFVDGAECGSAYVTRSGLVEYIYQNPISRRTKTFSMADGKWLAECALWVEWTHQGLLVAKSSASLVTLDCGAMRGLVETQSPELRAMFKCFAVLFAHEMDINGKIATDLAPPTETLESLTERSMDFSAMDLPNTFGAATPPESRFGGMDRHLGQAVSKLRQHVVQAV